MDLPADVVALIEDLRREIAELRVENLALKQEVADLRRQLGKNSSNSSKPPSSDGLAKKPRIAVSLRSPSGKASGGQIGHQGDTLRPVPQPDKVERHAATHCRHCQAALSPDMVTGLERRQVFDMPEPRLEVTEHQAQVYTCACCHGVTRAAFAAGVSAHVQYGPRIRAAAMYLNTQHLVPEDRVGEIMHDLFAAPRLCPASIVAWSEKQEAEWAPLEAHIADKVAQATVRHVDETGFRVGAKGQWLHVVSTAGLTHYRVAQKRGDICASLRGGVIVHDHFKTYLKLADVDHALCNAHHLRELKLLTEIEKEPWARRMSRLLLAAAQAVRLAAARGQTMLPAARSGRIVAIYDAIVRQGLALHEALPALVRKPGARGRAPKRPGHNLLVRLRDFKTEVLRFLFDFAVPFTNNQAEQDIRMMKVKMKISGGFRTEAGAKTFATLRSVLATARKRGWSLLTTLTRAPTPLINALSTA